MVKDLVGKTFGRLTVLSLAYIKTNAFWNCLCACGVNKVVNSSSLIRGNTKSCGCWYKEFNTLRFQKDPQETNLVDLWHNYRAGATKRKLSFELSKDEFRYLVSQPCTYCGLPPSRELKTHRNQEMPGRANGILYTGIDRVDSNIGYTSKNSVSCCFICNRAKNNMTMDEWESWLERIALHRAERGKK